MIRSVAVVPQAGAEAWPRAAAVALIAMSTPGCSIPGRPGLRALQLSFDTLASELEAASLRVPQAAAAVHFAIAHARAISAFVTELQHKIECIDLMVCESAGYTRSVTVARWAAQRLGCLPNEPAPAAGIASCEMMEGVLRRVTCPARHVTRRVPLVSEAELQP